MASYPWNHGDVLTAADLNAAIAMGIGGSGPPTGAASGDLTGTYPAPTVARINGIAPAASATTDTTNATNITSGALNPARLPTTTVTAASYTNANITVDQYGRITQASNGSATGGVSSVGTGTGLTGGPITTSGTISLANTAVSPGNYTNSNITVDAQGRITAASNGTAGGGGTGTVTSITAGTGLSGGTITTSGTITANWALGSVTALAGGLTLAAGTLSISGLGYGQLPTEVQQLPISFPFSGKPAASAVVNVPMAFAVTVPASLAGAVVYDTTQTTSNAVFTLNKISGGSTSALGTITVTSSSHTSCSLSGAGGSLAVGDVLQMVAPSSQDATLADIGISVLCSRV